MSFQSGVMQARFFLVENPGEAANPFRAEEALENNKFPFDWQGGGSRTGWVSQESMLEASFKGSADWRIGSLYCFTLRVDNRTVPGGLLRARLKQECEAWQRENQAPKIPRRIKQEIKDRLTDELLAETPAKTRTFDVVWDIQTNLVLFTGLTEALEEALKTLWLRTFGCSLASLHPLSNKDRTPEFYLWAWWRIAVGGGFVEAEDVRLVGKLQLTDGDVTTAVEAETNVNGVPEALLAARNGKLPEGLKMAFTLDNCMSVTLQVRGVEMLIPQLKLSLGTEERFDREANIIDRHNWAVRVWEMLRSWAQEFQALRDSDGLSGWDHWRETDLLPWLNGD